VKASLTSQVPPLISRRVRCAFQRTKPVVRQKGVTHPTGLQGSVKVARQPKSIRAQVPLNNGGKGRRPWGLSGQIVNQGTNKSE
jgi:hypothetical protein